MRIEVASDLHLEFYEQPLDFVKKFNGGADVLVLAGDICTHNKDYSDVFKELTRHYEHVLYVPGNHEYYGSYIANVEKKLNALKAIPKLSVLDGEVATLCGQRFLGGTMWFQHTPQSQMFERYMNDFRVIHGGFGHWVYKQNAKFHAVLANELKPTDVVVTHHLPHHKSTPERFADSEINCFFVSDESSVINAIQPKMWIHGHTHDPCDYYLGDTRVICNPFGYPDENHSTRMFYDL